MLQTVLIRVNSCEPCKSYQRIHDFKNEQEIKEFVEFLSLRKDVINVEVIPCNRTDMSYNEYLKRYFK